MMPDLPNSNEDLEAALQDLRSRYGETALKLAITQIPATQGVSATSGGVVRGVSQVTVPGTGNMVLSQVRVEQGGTLIVGESYGELTTDTNAIQAAIISYLRTIIERYRFISLQGLSIGSQHQLQIELHAIFINLHTDLNIPREVFEIVYSLQQTLEHFWYDFDLGFESPRLRRDLGSPWLQDLTGNIIETLSVGATSSDMLQWAEELLPPHWSKITKELTTAIQDEIRPHTLRQLGREQYLATYDTVRRHLSAIREESSVAWSSTWWTPALFGPRTATALEAIRHYRALVLLGDPGSGKTTVLRHLSLGFAHAYLTAGEADARVDPMLAWPGNLPLPILVQLRRFADGLTSAPQSAGALLHHIEAILSGDRLQPLAQLLQARLEDGSVLLMLDGLDEVADDTRRAWVSRAVALFQNRFRQSRIVLTSRIYAYRDASILPPPFHVVTIQSVMTDDQDDFLRRWYRAALLQGSELASHEQGDIANQKSADLIDALTRRPSLRAIAANPLLLTMIALLHQHQLRLPQQRAELYEACLLLLLEQWEQRHAEGERAGMAAELGVPNRLSTTGERLALIQPIAYELQLEGREEARTQEVQRWLLERFLDLADNDGMQAKELIKRFLDFLEGRSGILVARDIRDRYTFPHKTFQEYLAARELIYLGQKAVEDSVITYRKLPTWREVIRLVVGHLVATSQPLQAKGLAWKLLEVEESDRAETERNIVLAGELLEEIGSNLGADGRALKEKITQGLTLLVAEGALSGRERVEAAFLLARLGDNRVPTPDQSGYWCYIEPGVFWYSGDTKGRELERMELEYHYHIGRYAVTNAEYARFILDGGYNDRRWWDDQGGDAAERSQMLPLYWYDDRYNAPTQPVVGLSLHEVRAYCTWLSALGHADGWLPLSDVIRLPSSLERERAGRHVDRRRHPWGNTKIGPELANYDTTAIGRPSPVGCFPAGAAACGALDLSGNVWEWSEARHQGVSAGGRMFAVYGGAYDSEARQLRCESRKWRTFEERMRDTGFRVIWAGRGVGLADPVASDDS